MESRQFQEEWHFGGTDRGKDENVPEKAIVPCIDIRFMLNTLKPFTLFY